MLIRHHLNLMFRNPIVGALEPGDERFPDMSVPYDRALAQQLRDHASTLGISLQEGVYGGLLGPTYETPAEVRMLATLGADAVGRCAAGRRLLSGRRPQGVRHRAAPGRLSRSPGAPHAGGGRAHRLLRLR